MNNKQSNNNCDKPFKWTKLIAINILAFLKVMTLLVYGLFHHWTHFDQMVTSNWSRGTIPKIVWQAWITSSSSSSENQQLHSSCFSIGKSQKSRRLTSGLYGGCASVSILNFVQRPCIKAAVWGRTLSWCEMNVFEIAGCFLQPYAGISQWVSKLSSMISVPIVLIDTLVKVDTGLPNCFTATDDARPSLNCLC